MEAVLVAGAGMNVGRRFPSYVQVFDRGPALDVVADVEALRALTAPPLEVSFTELQHVLFIMNPSCSATF